MLFMQSTAVGGSGPGVSPAPRRGGARPVPSATRSTCPGPNGTPSTGPTPSRPLRGPTGAGLVEPVPSLGVVPQPSTLTPRHRPGGTPLIGDLIQLRHHVRVDGQLP